ncbi:MAG: 50S ribosomal protein L27 [bacterium]|nr:50S ribosomal protein L27 [bacterium]
MAHKKAGSSTALGRDSAGKRLGIKITDGQFAKQGAIIVRQRGTVVRPGKNVLKGSDDTLFAAMAGIVKFSRRKRTRFDNTSVYVKFVEVVPKE